MILQTQPTQKTPKVTWEKLPADYILPDDPAENIQQPPPIKYNTMVRASCPPNKIKP